MKVRLKDIANKAGISISTVSRVLNQDRDRPAGKKTSEKIWAIASEMGYQPNINARNLVTGETWNQQKKVGCIYSVDTDINNNPYFSCIGIGIQREVDKHGLNLSYALPENSLDMESLKTLKQKYPVDGMIVIGEIQEEKMEFLIQVYDNLVYAGVSSSQSGINQVTCDGRNSIIEAYRYLNSMGHTAIGFAGLTLCKGQEDYRFQAYMECVNTDPKAKPVVIQTLLRTSKAYLESRLFFKTSHKNISALICANDAIAFGVMKAAKESGLVVPKDLSILGMENVEMAAFVTPELTTYSYPKRELGRQAVNRLIDIMNKSGQDPDMTVLPYALIERESVARISDDLKDKR